MIAGKAMMDRNAPHGAARYARRRATTIAKALIERWRGRGRLDYAVTPRFAITSTQAQLEAAGALMREFPDVYMQTHVDENARRDRLRRASSSPKRRTISTSMRGRGFSARARCSATAST